MRILLAFIFISSLTFAQDFEDKYDISGFLNKTHSMKNNRKKFKEFKAHLQKLNFKFDYNFRKEYKRELANYPEALDLFNKYRRKKISTYFILFFDVTNSVNVFTISLNKYNLEF